MKIDNVPPIKGLKIALYHLGSDPETDDPILSWEDTRWRDYSLLFKEGFNGSETIHLTDAWQEIFAKRKQRYEGQVTGYETIVKFGELMQLKKNYLVVIEVEYAR